MRKEITLIAILFSVLAFQNMASAQEWKTLEIPRTPTSCPNNTCTINLDEISNFAKYEIDNTFEISTKLIHTTSKTHYTIAPPFGVCPRILISNQNEYLFNLKFFKNDELVKEEPYIDIKFVDEDNTTKKMAILPCYNVNSNDTVSFDYLRGNKILPATRKFLFLNVTADEFFYPFDKYFFTSWSQPDLVYYKRTDRIILPNSFEIVENETEFSCPFVVKFKITKGNTTLMESILFSDTYTFEASFVQSDNNRIIIFPSAVSPPLDWVQGNSEIIHNLTLEQQKNVLDKRTGCFLRFTFERTQLVIYLFLISSASMLLSSLYFLNCKKYPELLGAIFGIWAFQEGLNQLLPLVRPTIVTLFDLNIIYMPIIAMTILFIKFSRS